MAGFFGYECRRWSIIVLCSFFLVFKIIEICFIIFVKGSKKPEHEPESESLSPMVMVVLEIITFLILLMGFYGAYKENFYLSLAFCVLFTIALVYGIVAMAQDKKHIVGIVIMAIIILLDSFFVFELYGNQYGSGSSSSSGKSSKANSQYSSGSSKRSKK